MYINAVGRTLATSAKTVNTVSANGTGTIKNDLFNSRPGDVLTGGLGDDTYNLWDNSSVAVEILSQGIDTVVANFWGAAKLADNIENLVLASKGSIAGTGNALDNMITAGVIGAELNGLAGNDVLVGGNGGDLFRVKAGNGSDSIVNFTANHDIIKLDGYGISSFGQLMSMAKQVGDDVFFTFKNGEKLVLQDVQMSTLDSWDFGFQVGRSAFASREGVTTFSEAGRAQNWNGWYVVNNAWGAGSMKAGKDYTLESSFDKKDMTAGTTFNWSMPNSTVMHPPILAYPEVIFGVPPMGAYAKNPSDTAAVFPAKVSDLVSLIADQDVSFVGNTGGFNVSYDIWLTSKPNGDRSTITNEVMVWVHKGDFPPLGDLVGTYQAGDATAKIYHKGTYTAVVFDKDLPKAELDITAILAKLTDMGIVNKDEYLASVELGAEVVSGAGSLTINNLDLEVKTRGENGSVIVKEVTGSGTKVHVELPQEIAEPLFVAGTEEVLNDHGVVVGSKVTTADAGGFTQKMLDLNGRVLSFDKITEASGVVNVHHYNTSGKFVSADVTRPQADGSTVEEHYNAAWKFTGADTTTVKANGDTTTVHYGATWKVTGSETVTVESPTRTATHFYDATFKFAGAEVEVLEKSGAVSVQHYDKNWKFAGQDSTTLAADGTATAHHYGADWAFTGMEVARTGADGVVTTASYDSKWRLTGNDYAGTDANDTIKGSSSTNHFYGSLGSDRLVAGSGADFFHFDSAIGQGDVDTIVGFSTVNDTIMLDQSIFAAIKATGTLAAGSFRQGSAALDADDRIIFDNKTGALYYDADGNGAGKAMLFAQVQSSLPLTAADFTVHG